MSAYIVDKVHIDLLVQAMLETYHKPFYVHRFEPTEVTLPVTTSPAVDPVPEEVRHLYVWGDISEADFMGRILWAENLESIKYRYPTDAEGQWPGPAGLTTDDVYCYAYERLPSHGNIPAVTVLKAIQGYEYQSCEHPGWSTSIAHAAIERLQSDAIGRLPGYEDAPWEATDRLMLMKGAA